MTISTSCPPSATSADLLADAPGPTFLSYTPNGRKLVTVGLNGALRIFQHGSNDEPAVIDVVTDNHLAVAAANDFFVVGAEDGTVTKYSLVTNSMEEILVRTSLPVRDLALSPDTRWIAVASEYVRAETCFSLSDEADGRAANWR